MADKLKAVLEESVEQVSEAIKLLEHIKRQALGAVELVESSKEFKKKLKERIAAGQFVMLNAFEDLKTKLKGE